MPIFLKTKDYLKMDIEKYLYMVKDKEEAINNLIWELEIRLGRLAAMVIHAKLKLDVSIEKLKETEASCRVLDKNLCSLSQFFDDEIISTINSGNDKKKKLMGNKNDYNSCRKKYNQLTEQYSQIKNKLDEARAIQIKLKSDEIERREKAKAVCKIPEIEKINFKNHVDLEWVKNKATIDVEFDRMMDEIKSKLL